MNFKSYTTKLNDKHRILFVFVAFENIGLSSNGTMIVMDVPWSWPI